MSEFFLELFSEEIPAGLQKNLREKISKMANGTERICQPKRIGDIIPSLSSKLGGDA